MTKYAEYTLITRLKEAIWCRGGKSTHIFFLSRSTDTCVQKRLVKVELPTQRLHSSQINKVQVVKCTQSIKVKSFPLKDISVQI